jgi:hypothetical protein
MMINDVRNIVDFILNKESRGYITPLQFNTFAKQAQQEIVDDYFYEYNKAIVGKTQRANYKDTVTRIKEAIDNFIVAPTSMSFLNGFFSSPSNLYTTINIIYNGKEVEEVPREKLSYFLTNTVAGPSVFYPAYVKYEDKYKVYPDTIQTGVQIIYFRNPKDPNWTYEMIGGNAVFNPSKQGFQDLEIGYDDKFKIISKILKYAGLNMREPDIVGAAIALENQGDTK